MADKYTPRPIDTSKVELLEEILELSEKLAENVHEVWAAGRIADGWQYGEERDDERKLHPCIVPYDELSEVEKDYDRRTSQETLKVMQVMRRKINPFKQELPRGHF